MPLANALSDWETSNSRLATIFRYYLDQISDIMYGEDRTDYILNTLNTNGIQKQLYTLHHESLLKRLHTFTTNPTTTALLPTILNPITSLALHSLPRFHPPNRISPEHYTILLCRKLRLPLNLPSHCLCNKPLDKFGDHLFSCRRLSKKPMHNIIRNTLYTILQRIGPLTPFINHPSSIHLEPSDLIPDHTTDAHPADIGIVPAPTPAHMTPLPQPYIALDITTVNPVPATPPHEPLTSSEATTLIHRAHHAGVRRKYLNDPDVTLLNTKEIILLPFTYDSFGSPGYFARRLLLSDDSTSLPPAPKPPWTNDKLSSAPNAISHPEAYHAYCCALHPSLPTTLLPLADKWWHDNYPSHKFGDSYHTSTPTQWALQTLAINISIAIAAHASSSISLTKQAQTQSKCASLAIPLVRNPPLDFRAPGPAASDLLFSPTIST